MRRILKYNKEKCQCILIFIKFAKC
ncbi:hypothetical protein BU101_03440 [Staphylococcus shinii]|uniref:Uncharacterized protein n=1 Tax=Staphylococcus shinii TaxID=2912228 RepID=A0A418ICU6_9STAP|nr:hypothetical protein BU112_12150 [Staphylococcus shinii]RIN09210.1 hypothetical protein BU101_03440 [Staphylococcus shinii]